MRVPFADTDHPWQTAFPVVCSDRRLRDVLHVSEPDPDLALRETVEWLWANRASLSGTEAER